METAQQPAATAGTVVLDRYALVERLGAGGFGTVWLARDERLERAVAVKRIALGSHRAAAARAEREALAAARLSHPAVVALYEAGRDADAVYLVSELVRGATLGDLLEDGALSDRDVVLIGIAMCDALAHAHARGVVHRDVKPGNVLVPDAPSDGVVAKLTDFGIARMAGDDALTATGDVVGTLAYMAPEQAEGRGATAASDLYSLGLVLYEALSGVNPVRQANAAATARSVGMRLPPLRRMRRDLPRGLCAALDACVLPDPALRGSVDALRAVLAGALPEMADDPGVVDGPWAPRFAPGVPEPPHRAEPTAPDLDPAQPWRPAVRVGLPGRAMSAAMSAALAPAVLSLAPGPPPADPLLAAGFAAAATALLPRLGWIAVAATLAGWLGAGSAGAALVVGAAALAVVVLVPRAPAWWSMPGAAVGLGFLAAAGAFPALAGQARGALTRAALGALGYWWLALAELVVHRRLLAGPAGDAGPGAAEAGHALSRLVEGGTLGVAALWAFAAAMLPVVVRGRNAAVDLAAACVWAAAVALATNAVTQAAGAGQPRGVLAGAALAALVAVLARAVRRA